MSAVQARLAERYPALAERLDLRAHLVRLSASGHILWLPEEDVGVSRWIICRPGWWVGDRANRLLAHEDTRRALEPGEGMQLDQETLQQVWRHEQEKEEEQEEEQEEEEEEEQQQEEDEEEQQHARARGGAR